LILFTEFVLLGARVFGHYLQTFADCMLNQVPSFFFRFLFLTIFEMFFWAFSAFLAVFPQAFNNITISDMDFDGFFSTKYSTPIALYLLGFTEK